MKKFIASIFRKLYPMAMQTPQLPKKAVVIGAPHTSMWDAVLMIMAFWYAKRPYKFMVKNQLGSAPILGSIIRALGGVSVDRSHHHGVVDQLIQKFDESEEFLLVLAPKGTRAVKKNWRSGFYHIALGAGVPVVFGFIDARTKVYGWSETPYYLSGDVRKDMDAIREFYAGKEGLHPDLTCTPHLKDEDE